MGEQEIGISGDTNSMTYQQLSTKKRVLFFDQIKALMVALVIVVHVLFAHLFGWYGVRIPSEESSDPLFQVVTGWFIYFRQTFFTYMLFLLSGYFVPRSVHKKGIVDHLKVRLSRIGIPFLLVCCQSTTLHGCQGGSLVLTPALKVVMQIDPGIGSR